ncbi:MAG: deoxyribonuclease IV [Chitinispirillales bacterium]|jgi:deoxyribonuclease-4|nr:deoxyribonuclease IV [Chitinispirillales bacterium]
MFTIGCHLSSSKGFLAMGKEAVKIGANTFQFFTRNPRGGAVKPLDLIDIEAYNRFSTSNGLCAVLAHAPYTMNPCAEKAGLREFALNVMRDDLSRLSHIPDSLYNFHPGCHVGQGVDIGIDLTAQMLNSALKPGQKTTVLIETMSGKGSEIGRSFEEIQSIIEKVEQNEHLGVCLDTCHVFSAGYDIVHNLDGVLDEFDKIIGLSRLKAIHLNDNMTPFGSRKDRHEKIGKGTIGLDAFGRIVNHPILKSLPFYLETPNEIEGYAEEIVLLKSLGL